MLQVRLLTRRYLGCDNNGYVDDVFVWVQQPNRVGPSSVRTFGLRRAARRSTLPPVFDFGRVYMFRLVLTLIACALVSCGSKDANPPGEGGDKAGGSLTPGQQMLLESGQDDLKEIEAKLKKGEVPSTLDCAGYNAASKNLEGTSDATAKSYLEKAKKACEYDVPVAIVKDWQKKIAEGAGSNPNSGCYEAAEAQLKRLKASHPDDAEVKALIEAVTKACPNVKL